MTSSVESDTHIRPGYRRYNTGRHMIYFRITPYNITIIRILHARMDTSRHP
ncbi:type II toxin-antitoxin system RelE/ParE family toxin [Nitrosospira multiformis]|uniref:type II toxin-antitoxin system RelE/ParE family toxin n=1 Tax=Nitrosospira multiformis TaxID=1231 RepID=UPI000D2FED13|nr:type II toxin-antitoxin system RelE/ParE family toxin [Nitrosospira multiformis]